METWFRRHWFFVGILSLVGLFYLLTLQTIPNGSGNPYMIDVGETQIALNIWGTLHATGYPLYTILGNLLTPLPQIVGVNPAASASLVSTFWTFLGLVLLYKLLYQLTQQAILSSLVILPLAFTRSLWMHSVIAEVYSLSFAILIGLWMIALGSGSFQQKLWGLALLGGIGIAHHRALALAGLGLIFALLPDLRTHWKQLPRLMAVGIPLFLLGFLPYLYLPLRANAQAEWLYAKDVKTWDGFWFNFWGREADYLVKRPHDVAGWVDNLTGTRDILERELTLTGLVIAVGCVITALWFSPHRCVAWVTTLSGVGFFAFAVSYHQAVLPEAILMMVLPSLAVNLALTLDYLRQQYPYALWGGSLMVLLWVLALIPQQYRFIHDLTHNRAAFDSIEAASAVPREPFEKPVFMLSWGPRYFAASYSRLVTGENRDLKMVDHTADFVTLGREGYTFYTESDTLYGYPVAWWEERLGTIYLTSVDWNLVRLGTQPRLVENMDTSTLEAFMTDGIWLAGYQISCKPYTYEPLLLSLGWYAATQPQKDYSIKIHLTPEESDFPLAQADAAAPVHGWRPTSTFQAGEIITDHYKVPRIAPGKRLVIGLYERLADGSFANYGDYRAIIPAECT